MAEGRPVSEPIPLNDSEASVLRELGERESDAEHPRLARSYRRLLELSRSSDAVDAILAAHIARELLAVVPGAFGIELPPGRLDYVSRVAELAAGWPAEARSGEPPAHAVQELRRLLADHELASGRAREGPRALLGREDRGRAGYVLETPVERWVTVTREGSSLAHRIKDTRRDLPDPEEVRRLTEEVTAMLLALLAPYFVGIAEVDRLLAIADPTEEHVRQLAPLLNTPSRNGYFFDRADERWLPPLANAGAILRTPAALLEVGDGYVQAPAWPQGRFLVRMASIRPEVVAEVVAKLPGTDNPRVVSLLAEIARKLPPDLAAGLAPDLARRMSIPLAVDYAALDAAELARELAQAGFATAGTDILMAVIDAAMSSPRDMDWHLEQILAGPVDAIAPIDGGLGPKLRTRLSRLLRKSGSRRRYSTLWVRNIDIRPQYRADADWLLANALYRVLVASPLGPALELSREMLNGREPLFARIALAAIGDRRELAQEADALLLDPAHWDKPETTRYEFRRAFGSLWGKASPDAQRALLDYAEAASEAEEFVVRLRANGVPHEAGDVFREWRSLLLHSVREEVPEDWQVRNGPLSDVGDQRIPEITAGWSRIESPVSDEELRTRTPDEVLALLRDWTPEAGSGVGDAALGALADVAALGIAARIGEFREMGGAIARLRPESATKILSTIARSLRDEHMTDYGAALQLTLDLAWAHLGDGATDDWSAQIRRSVADIIGHAAHQDQIDMGAVPPALAVIEVLLGDPDPSPEYEARDRDGGDDIGMLALNTVRGEAMTAAIELFLACRRAGDGEAAKSVSKVMRRVTAEDRSRSVRAAIGLRLPWLLGRDSDHHDEWHALLFGDDVSEESRAATWDAYLIYGRFFGDIALLLAPQYRASVQGLRPRPQDDRTRPRDEDEQLGIHVATAHLLAMPVEADGQWLEEFYRRTAGWLRGRVTRWIAEQAASAEVSDDIRGRARKFLEGRVNVADPAGDAEELHAITWCASATDHETEVLEKIVLPALEKTRGTTENGVGAVSLAIRQSTDRPYAAARAVQLLIEGDQWSSLPHIASAELRSALHALMDSPEEAAREIASDAINTLGAQGFLEFRDLLNGGSNGD